MALQHLPPLTRSRQPKYVPLGKGEGQTLCCNVQYAANQILLYVFTIAIDATLSFNIINLTSLYLPSNNASPVRAGN